MTESWSALSYQWLIILFKIKQWRGKEVNKFTRYINSIFTKSGLSCTFGLADARRNDFPPIC